jgi:4-methyl-5(b-hydroxyethyl)-thiazole monophosphate biosynthesis
MLALLLAEGFEEVEAITTADFLIRAGIDVKLAGVGGSLIKGAHGITVKADVEIDALPEELDGVILPGGMPGSKNLAKSEKVISLVKRLNKEKKPICAICAAPAVVLLRTGILGGKKVTSYPGYEDKFTESQYLEKSVVADGNIITSRGAGTAPYFAFKIIEVLKGEEAASKVQQAVLL